MLNIVKCNGNFEFEKRTHQNFITQSLVCGGGYILAGGGWLWMLVDIFWLVVGGFGSW